MSDTFADGYEAGGAIKAFHLCKNSGGKAVTATANSSIIGVNAAAARKTGDEVLVTNFRKVQVTAGAAIVKGVHIASDANGQAITTPASGKTIGRAVTAAAAAGDIVWARLNPFS